MLLWLLACTKNPDEVIVTTEQLQSAVKNKTYAKDAIKTLDPTPTSEFTHADLESISQSNPQALIDLYNAIVSSDGTNESAATFNPIANRFKNYLAADQRNNLLKPPAVEVDIDYLQ